MMGLGDIWSKAPGVLSSGPGVAGQSLKGFLEHNL